MAQKPSMRAIKNYRWQELGLFIIPFLILLMEMLQLLLARSVREGVVATSSLNPKNFPTIQALIPILGLIALLLAVNIILSFSFRKADQILLPLVGLLSGIGVLMVTRLGPNLRPFPDPSLGTRQLIWVILGILMVGVTLINALRVKDFNSPNHDQLNIGPLALQPSELLKIFLVIFFAAYLTENRDVVAAGNLRIGPLRLPPFRQLGPLILMLALALLLFFGIRELGLALLIYGIFLCMIS